MIDPDEMVWYNGVKFRIKDVPNRLVRQSLGYGHHNPCNRPVVPGDWPYLVDTCVKADESEGVWLDGNTLVCDGCGLDCT